MEYISEMEKVLETALLQNSRDMLGIYQLKPCDDLHYHMFTPYKTLRSAGHSVKRENYLLVYIETLEDRITLDSIFYRFNMERPMDFRGHSLSISDIIVIQRAGAVTAHYVDEGCGYMPIPGFINKHK